MDRLTYSQNSLQLRGLYLTDYPILSQTHSQEWNIKLALGYPEDFYKEKGTAIGRKDQLSNCCLKDSSAKSCRERYIYHKMYKHIA